MGSETPGPSEAELHQPEVKRRVGFWRSLFGRKNNHANFNPTQVHQDVTQNSDIKIPQQEVKKTPTRWEQAVIREHTRLEALQKQIVDTQGAEALSVMLQLGMYAGPQFSREENALWLEEMRKREQAGELKPEQVNIVKKISEEGGGAAEYSDWQNEEKAIEDGMIPRRRLEALYKRNPSAKAVMEKWLAIAIAEAKKYSAWEKHIKETKGEQALETEVPPRFELTPEENTIWRDMMQLKGDMGLIPPETQAFLKDVDGRTAFEDRIAQEAYDKFAKVTSDTNTSLQDQPIQKQGTILPFPQSPSSDLAREKAA